MVILLGSNGYIGQEFKKQLRALKVETYCLEHKDYDYQDVGVLRQVIHDKKPDFLINCVGYVGHGDIEDCEINNDLTRSLNLNIVHTIQKACAMGGVPWGHVSCGSIYQGSSPPDGYTEDHLPNFSFGAGNSNTYSGTKAQAEEVINTAGGNIYIWRLKLPFDENDDKRNYISQLINKPRILAANNSMSHKGDCVRYCLQLWQQKANFGTYNVVNTGSVTTEQITDKINELLYADKRFYFFESEDQMYQLNRSRARVSSCVLDNAKLRKAIHPKRVRPLSKAIEHSIKSWKEQKEIEADIPKSFWE